MKNPSIASASGTPRRCSAAPPLPFALKLDHSTKFMLPNTPKRKIETNSLETLSETVEQLKQTNTHAKTFEACSVIHNSADVASLEKQDRRLLEFKFELQIQSVTV